MQLLKIKANGLLRFEENLEIDFTASQRVSNTDEDNLIKINEWIYLEPVVSFAGINASGKTSVLKLICFAINILQGKSINASDHINILRKQNKVTLEIFYLSNVDTINKLVVSIGHNKNIIDENYFIIDEVLYSKNTSSIKSKKDIFIFNDDYVIEQRNNNELPDDISMIFFQNKKNGDYIECVDTLDLTNNNKLIPYKILKEDPSLLKAILKFLDPTIEKLDIKDVNNVLVYHLKFKGVDEFAPFTQEELFNVYLSSGTNKGAWLYVIASTMLYYGGYIVIDEIENHLNKQIVISFMQLFLDKSINKKGAVLIFSTHYPEILDFLKRNDCVYILENSNNVKCTNLSEKLKRNDLKKSKVFTSSMFFNTAPSYENFVEFKALIRKR